MILIYVFVAFVGLIMGSFMSVLVSRLDVKKGIVAGRSECPYCLTQLKWYDLVPIFSFLYLRGKCRYCGAGISFAYPAMELATAGSFISYILINDISGPVSFYKLAVIFILLSLAFFDYKFYILPDKLIISGIILSLVFSYFFNREAVAGGLITGLVLSSFFAILYIVSRGVWLGLGDAKLAFLIGLVLGYPYGIWSIIFSVWVGALWGIALMMVSRANLKTALPFGSFMSAVAILFIIFEKYAYQLKL